MYIQPGAAVRAIGSHLANSAQYAASVAPGPACNSPAASDITQRVACRSTSESRRSPPTIDTNEWPIELLHLRIIIGILKVDAASVKTFCTMAICALLRPSVSNTTAVVAVDCVA